MIFALLVFAMGGGSRYDIDSIGPLRGLAAIFLAVGMWFQSGEQFRSIAVPFGLLAALAIWMAVQLVPLPPDWWRSLAGRADIATADDMLGLDGQWRPITFSPLRTLNSLSALIVPLAALVLLSLLDSRRLRRLRDGVIVIGVVSALLGVAQIMLRDAGGLYFYEITNGDSAVGLFSNRNHNALFLNIALIFSLFRSTSEKSSSPNQEMIWVIAARLVLVVGILTTSSRFGLILLALVGLAYAAHALIAMRGSGKAKAQPLWKTTIAILSGALAVGLIAIFAVLDRIPALDRIFQSGLSEGQRTETLPYITQLATDHFPFGVGFGAFEQAFRTIEPVALLRPRYLNHAHNDWLQLVVEGGLVGVLIFAIGVIWIAISVLRNWRLRRSENASTSGIALGVLTLALMLLHSVVDYPLRTPSIMLLAILAIVMITRKPKTSVS